MLCSCIAPVFPPRAASAVAPRLDSRCCLQVIDPHTHQYLDRLKDEPLFLALAQKVQFEHVDCLRVLPYVCCAQKQSLAITGGR